MKMKGLGCSQCVDFKALTLLGTLFTEYWKKIQVFLLEDGRFIRPL